MISYTGHAQVDDPSGPCKCKSEKQWDQEQPSSFTLSDQIEHKLAFLAYYIPTHCRVILVGHSIGAYIALEMLKRYHDKEKVLKCVLLFPTIERVDSAPSGKFWKFICHYLHWPFLMGTAVASFLPSLLQRWAVGWWMYLNEVENKLYVTLEYSDIQWQNSGQGHRGNASVSKLLVNKCSTGETKQKLFLACFVEQKKISLLINKFFKLLFVSFVSPRPHNVVSWFRK